MKKKSISFLLCLFLGWAGVHRFYEKKYITGLIWLLTRGLFFVGWIADLIIIIFSLVQQNMEKKRTLEKLEQIEQELSELEKESSRIEGARANLEPKKPIKIFKEFRVPLHKDGAQKKYAYTLFFKVADNCDMSRIYANEEKEVVIKPTDSGMELIYENDVFGFIEDERKKDMLKDWIKRGDPYSAILKEPGDHILLVFYRDKRKGNEFREQSVVPLTSYKSENRQIALSGLVVGDEVILVEDDEHEDTVFVCDCDEPIGKLPKKFAIRYLENDAYGAFIESIEKDPKEEFDDIYKPIIRIYW